MAVGGSLPLSILPVSGLSIAVSSAGIKKPGRKDLVLFELAPGSQCAAVFTTNAFCAAPVTLAKQHLALQQPRYWLINTGNANAGTGAQGLADAKACCALVAEQFAVPVEQVLPFSTGVIGEPLPMDKIEQAIPSLPGLLAADTWAAAAEGIMTTDTRPKGASRQLELQGQTITLSGISKGSGMICPNMATMLGFVATDLALSSEQLQAMLSRANELSFNRITVDGDTSTNDACMLVSTAQIQLELSEQELALVEQALLELMQHLAHAIVRDGEGATKFVTITVEQAVNKEEALAVAYTIAHSPLVKTALTASDANWGRILAAVGRAGVAQLNLEAVNIFLDQVQIVDSGARAACYSEEAGSTVVAQEEFCIRVQLGRGQHAETVWTTDLSNEYVRINAEYRS